MGRTPLDTPARLREVYMAALAVFAEVGYSRFNYDLVAAKARASKASLYQRWPSKARLIVDALEAHLPDRPQPDEGSFAEDVRSILRSWGEPADFDTIGVYLGLLEGSRQDADLERLRKEHIDQAYTEQLRSALVRAKDRGEVPEDVDAELVITALISNYVFHAETPGIADRIVDGLLRPLFAAKPLAN